jgi:hypothetical protein
MSKETLIVAINLVLLFGAMTCLAHRFGGVAAFGFCLLAIYGKSRLDK